MFQDRLHAGRALAAELKPLAEEEAVVLAIPRGGVPVAFEVASALHAPMDVITVRKLGAPQNPEFAVGAVAEDGSAVLDAEVARRLGLTRDQIEDVVQREVRELDRRIELYRDGWEPMDVHGRTVIIVDDGLATGLSDLAAVRALRKRGAARVIVAAPVASHHAVALLREEADDVVSVLVPQDFLGVGAWYEDFAAVSDEEVLRLMERAGTQGPAAAPLAREIAIDAGPLVLRGDLTVPADARGLVIFAHGSGSSRRSPRNRAVASVLTRLGLATLLFDLLTEQEEGRRDLVFDIPLLAERLQLATRWAAAQDNLSELPTGYFGASTGAAAALSAAAALGNQVRAVVSRGGRPDLAGDDLPRVLAPTLMIVGGLDLQVLELNRMAAARMRCEHRVVVVEGAGHLFEEPGTLDIAARLAGEWFDDHLAGSPAKSGAVAAGGG
jgi:putative phosphoribosyl transferase